MRWLAVLLAFGLSPVPVGADELPDDAFRAANQQARGGDLPRALAGYAALEQAGHESAALFWNWSQVAAARGATGEALWALLRARELEPGDPAIARELEALREEAGLDPAELAPEPLAPLARYARRFRLGLLGAGLLLVSLVAHALARFGPPQRRAVVAAWVTGATGLVLLTPVGLATLASPTAVVAAPDVPLLDAASPTAASLATLREGEVVLVLESSGAYLRLQDSSGARGWADAERVRRLERQPAD